MYNNNNTPNDPWHHHIARKHAQADLAHRRADVYAQKRNLRLRRAESAPGIVAWYHRLKAAHHDARHQHHARKAQRHLYRHDKLQLRQHRNQLRANTDAWKSQYGHLGRR